MSAGRGVLGVIPGGAMAGVGQIRVAATHAQPAWRQLASAVGLSLVLGLMLLGGYHLALRQLRSSRAGQAASKALQTSPQLKDLLGEPYRVRIEAGELNEEGTAHFTFAARGPKGSADLELAMRRDGAAWKITEGTIENDEGVIPLEVPAP